MGAMKVIVDFDRCESNAVCMGVAPEVFEVRDDDYLYILDENPGEDLRPKVEEAVRSCPKAAISIADFVPSRNELNICGFMPAAFACSGVRP